MEALGSFQTDEARTTIFAYIPHIGRRSSALQICTAMTNNVRLRWNPIVGPWDYPAVPSYMNRPPLSFSKASLAT
jgi:hypothetical protein